LHVQMRKTTKGACSSPISMLSSGWFSVKVRLLRCFSSYAGEALKRDFGMELGRITGLDPADPHFEETDPLIRLDETDAYYVDIIHTDANPLLSGVDVIHIPDRKDKVLLPG
jgi:hypothetical protein